MSKLTLSATPEVIRQARLLSQRRQTSISALFARFIAIHAALEEKKAEEQMRMEATPLCRQALEIGLRLEGGDFDEKKVLSEAICAKYLSDEK